VLLARVNGTAPGTEVGGPFTDRLVAKFGLPVAGWRGRTAPARGVVSHGGNGSYREKAREETASGHA
jgi:hypothetical protein